MHQTATQLLHHARGVRTVLAHDADQLAGELTNWQQRYDQISPGLFRGALTERQLPQLQVFRETLSQSVRQSCRVWPDAIWFGLPEHVSATRINGRQTGADAIMVQPGNVEFELVTPSDYRIYGVVASRQLLAETALAHGCEIDWRRVQSADLLRVDATERAAFVRTLARLLPEDATADAGAGDPDPAWRQAVLLALLDMLDHRCVEPALAASLQRRRRVVALAREYLDAHRGEAVTVPELCERVHVSRRTLQYCFEDVLGMSPMLYLRLMRLNGVRRQLNQGAPGRVAIGDVADAWGLSNFSQFSSDYRKLFGLCPSATLKARAQ
ncbi:AraC family ethanolamine operon transcriptional activator [Duganella sp. 1411]|uniref:helix-turn-helix domain-containing protein n=1 Tax=Duganella sp. 1411 TaxID=2806572 RepID=UPI001AE39F40|nr:helix-turn-helix domain-containing protein [Duganella sp. 1411]MBP1208254.1 AraC family ethanolamine operon transcriptional activator [Duganella sp. 1411]